MNFAPRTLSVLALTALAVPAAAQLQPPVINPPITIQIGRTVTGTSGRTVANPWMGFDQQATASASYSGFGSCSTSSTLATRLSFLGANQEAAYFGVNLGAAMLTLPGAQSGSFDMRVSGNQLVSSRFSTNQSLNGNLTAFLFPSNVQAFFFVGPGVITVGGNVLVTPSQALSLQLQNGSPSVRQTGQMSTSARGSLWLMSGGSRILASCDYGTHRLDVNLGATATLRSGTISGTASHAMGPYVLSLTGCIWFGLGEICSSIVNLVGGALNRTMI